MPAIITLKKKIQNRKRPRTRAVREYTAGGIVFRHVSETVATPTLDSIEILLIQDPLSRWSIPKGHVETGESLEETAIREVQEETGLLNLTIIDKLNKIHFFYRMEGRLIFMTTYVFLMEAGAGNDQIVPQKSEGITGVEWFSVAEAMEKIEYKDTQELLKLGLQKLKVLGAPTPSRPGKF